ncbi:GNAT family N-acetyltransferase, partial [Rhizobium ruizarguesonis]
MADVEIRTFTADDADAVLSVILPIQREEFGIDITADAQPDLRVIPDFYQSGKGQFWVAVKDGAIVGTVGLKDIGKNQAALRKMFVSAAVRGHEHGVAARLLDRLLTHARDAGLTDIF